MVPKITLWASNRIVLSLTRSPLIHTGLAAIAPIENITLSNYDYGEDLAISCVVDTCVSDMHVYLLKEDQLVESVTVPNGNTFVSTAHLKASEGLVGEYVCRAMTEKHNEVFTQSFFITGTVHVVTCIIIYTHIQFVNVLFYGRQGNASDETDKLIKINFAIIMVICILIHLPN